MASPVKIKAVEELTEQFQHSNATFFTEYRGLTVEELQELRRTLGQQTTYAVVKNTLTKIAATNAGVDSTLSDLLVGPSAIAFIKGDPVEAAKGLRNFSKEHPHLVIKGGVFEGKAMSAQQLAQLATLESREVLLAKLAGAMTASLSQAAALFNAPLSQFARLADALHTKAQTDPSVLAGETTTGQTDSSLSHGDSAPTQGQSYQDQSDDDQSKEKSE